MHPDQHRRPFDRHHRWGVLVRGAGIGRRRPLRHLLGPSGQQLEHDVGEPPRHCFLGHLAGDRDVPSVSAGDVGGSEVGRAADDVDAPARQLGRDTSRVVLDPTQVRVGQPDPDLAGALAEQLRDEIALHPLDVRRPVELVHGHRVDLAKDGELQHPDRRVGDLGDHESASVDADHGGEAVEEQVLVGVGGRHRDDVDVFVGDMLAPGPEHLLDVVQDPEGVWLRLLRPVRAGRDRRPELRPRSPRPRSWHAPARRRAAAETGPER